MLSGAILTKCLRAPIKFSHQLLILKMHLSSRHKVTLIEPDVNNWKW